MMRSIGQVMEEDTNMGFNPIGNVKVLQRYCCLRCKSHVELMEVKIPFGPNKGKVVREKHGCNCALIDQVREQQKRARVARLRALFNENSLINPALKKATFDNFDPSEFKKAYLQAKRYADEFDINKPRNLFFQGSFGTGKSHLSVSITKVVQEKGYSAIFISTPKLLTKIRNTYNKDSGQTEEQLLNAINSADLVVFDDIGAEGDITGWGMQKIFEVIDQRAGKHNIFTTNLSSDELSSSKALGRIFSRMMDNAEPVIMNGTDHRRKHFLEGVKRSV